MAIWDRFFGSAVSTATGYGMGSALGPALEPITQGAANEAWQLYPNRPLPPGLAAALVAQGIAGDATGAEEGEQTGYNGQRFSWMVALTQTWPELAVGLELWRRGLSDRGDFERSMRRHGFTDQTIGQLAGLRNVLPSVTDMVRFAVRETYTPEIAEQFGQYDDFPEAFATDAENVGLTRERARQYWAAHWDLPSTTQGAEMFHRGIIDRATFERLLRALDVMPFWRDKIVQWAQRIPPLSDLIRFAVREVYQPTTRAKYGLDDDYPARFTADAALHGMDEERARQYWAAHWRLPSVAQGYRMFHRGEITAAELDDLLRTQDYPSFWRNRLRNVAYLVPGRIDLRRLFAAGKITRAETKAGYQRLGYREPDAELLVQLAEAVKTGESGTRDLTSAELAAEYEGAYLTETQYRNRLAALGYDASEITEKVALGSTRKAKAARDRAVTKIGAQYVAWQISRSEADALLQRTAVRPEARSIIFEGWDIAREANVKQMTAAQVRSAFKKGVYDRARALAELLERGWRDGDANDYLDSA